MVFFELQLASVTHGADIPLLEKKEKLDAVARPEAQQDKRASIASSNAIMEIQTDACDAEEPALQQQSVWWKDRCATHQLRQVAR